MKKKDKKFYQMFGVKKHVIDEYDEWNKKRYENREDKDNIFPVGISDAEFRKFIIDIFLGDEWYVNYSAGRDQINEEVLEEIIYMFTKRTPKERDEQRNKSK